MLCDGQCASCSGCAALYWLCCIVSLMQNHRSVTLPHESAITAGRLPGNHCLLVVQVLDTSPAMHSANVTGAGTDT